MPDITAARESWTYLLELAVACLAGSLGALVRLANPTERRTSVALLWEIPTGAALGTAGWALGDTLGLLGWAQFLAAWTAGAVGQAVIMDVVTALAKARLMKAGLILPPRETRDE